LHVLIGTGFLIVCLFRHISYHFTRRHHLGLEIAIWYWHFVDIVWIFLFVFVYVWGS
jgi:heme/copper-type cytochrome/quinol oxidase subunit 3